MSGLRTAARNHLKWLIILTFIIIILIWKILVEPRKETYTDLHHRVNQIEQWKKGFDPCRPSLGQQCEEDE